MRLSNIVLGGVSAMLQIHSAGAIPVNATSSKMLPERRWTLDGVDVDSVNCHKEWDPRDHLAYGRYIREGIEYLRKTPTGKPTLDPGNCERVSCSWNSAIYWCNESPEATKELPSYGAIAEAAQIIQDGCKTFTDKHGQEKTGEGKWIMGEVFMKDQWSVSVRRDEDKC